MAEAYFVAIIVKYKDDGSNYYRFITLEFSKNPDGAKQTVLGEWTNGSHRNYGDGGAPQREAFTESLKRLFKNKGKVQGLSFGSPAKSKPLIKPLSSVSRVVDENGEPQLKIYPEFAEKFEDEQDKDFILAVAIVNEDLLNEDFDVETFPTGKLENPMLRATKNGQTITIIVSVSRFPSEPQSYTEKSIENFVVQYGENLYEAEVALMEVEPDETTGKMCFFVNYRGLKPLLA